MRFTRGNLSFQPLKMGISISATRRVGLLFSAGLLMMTVASGFETSLCNGNRTRCGHGSRCMQFNCLCKSGFVKSSTDETASPRLIYCHESCTDENRNCSTNSSCDGINNRDETYTCVCSAGYTRATNGYCLGDNDQCSSQPCGANAACANIPGSFNCTCDAGYSRHGYQKQTADCIASPTKTIESTESTTASTKTTLTSIASTSMEQSDNSTTSSILTMSDFRRPGNNETTPQSESPGNNSFSSTSGPTTTTSEQRMDQNKHASQTLIIALAAGISGGVVLIAIVVIILMTRRRRRKNQIVDKDERSEANEEVGASRISLSNSEANYTTNPTKSKAVPLVVVRMEVSVLDDRSSVHGDTNDNDNKKLNNMEPVEYSLPKTPKKNLNQFPNHDLLYSNDNIQQNKASKKRLNQTENYDTLYSFGVKSANREAGNLQLGLSGSGNAVRSSDGVDTSSSNQGQSPYAKDDIDVMYDTLQLPRV